MSDPSLPVKDKDPKKQQIIDAATQVFLDKGFASASMNDIVKASGMSKGGVYHHFDSKDDIVLTVIQNYANAQLNVFQFDGDSMEAVGLLLDGEVEKAKALIEPYLIDDNQRQLVDLYIDQLNGKTVTHFLNMIFAMTGEAIKHSQDFSKIGLEFSVISLQKPEVLKILQEVYHKFSETLSQLIELGIKRGEYKKDTNVEHITTALMALCDGLGIASLIYIEGGIALDTLLTTLNLLLSAISNQLPES